MFGDKNPMGSIGGLIDLVTAVKNLVTSANQINQTLAQYLPNGSSIVLVSGTITPAGTTGAQTINKATGSVNFAAAAATLIVTNSIVSSSSIIIATVLTNDATMFYARAIPAAGSFTLIANAVPTAETRVGFLVITAV